MIYTLQITDDETEKSYLLTEKNGRLFLENDEEESIGLTEKKLFDALDNLFKEL